MMSIPLISRSQGSSRLRTQDFKKFRADSKKGQISVGDSRRDLIVQSAKAHIDFQEQKIDLLPPEWVDTYEKIQDDLSKLEEKMTKLKEVQAERMSIVFGDTTLKDKEIERLIQETTKLIKDIETFVLNFSKGEGSNEDLKIRKNIQKKLAARLKEITQKHRVIQKVYVEKVQNHPVEDLQIEGGLFDDKNDDSVSTAKIREAGINILVGNLHELALIFKELNSLVVDQGTLLDRIDFNLSNAKDNTEKAVKQLIIAEKHQNCTRATSCILLLIVLIVLLLLCFIFKNS